MPHNSKTLSLYYPTIGGIYSVFMKNFRNRKITNFCSWNALALSSALRVDYDECIQVSDGMKKYGTDVDASVTMWLMENYIYRASLKFGKYRAFQILGLTFSQLVVKIFWSKLVFKGECKPKNLWFSKCYGAILRPPQDRVWKCSFTIFDEGLGGKASCLLQILNVLVFSDQMNHLFKSLLEEEEF